MWKLFKGGKYSREETIRGNTVYGTPLLPFFEHHEVFLLVVTIAEGAGCCFQTSASVILMGFCCEMTSNKGIVTYLFF